MRLRVALILLCMMCHHYQCSSRVSYKALGRGSSQSISGSTLSHNSIFHQLLPKLELHSHLHGNIRSSSMIDIANNHPNKDLKHEVEDILHGNRDIDKCFKLFGLLHKLVTSKQILKRIISEVFEDFMNENVIYLEIRTTPRELEDGSSIEEYLSILLDMTSQHNQLYSHKMIVRVLISFDRSRDVQYSENILNKILDIMNEPIASNIVGIDFSGNPKAKGFNMFKPLLMKARENGFKLSIHSGELPADQCEDINELDDILEFQ